MNWLLLHGFVGSSEDFVPLRSALGNPESVYAPDWPGHGTRSGLREREDYSLEAHLRIIDDALAGLRPGPVTLVGYSMGGRILQHWLASRSPKLPTGSRVALVSTSPGITGEAERANRRAGDAAVARLLREEGMTRFLHYWHWQTMFQPLMRLPREQLSPILRRRAECDPEGLALSLEAVGSGALHDTWSALPRLRTRVDLVAGELDPRYAELTTQMARLAPSAHTQIVPGAGHALHLEAPVALAKVLSLDFLV